MAASTPLFKRLGLSADRADPKYSMDVADSTKVQQPKPTMVWMHKLNLVDRQARAALVCYLTDNFVECAARARETVICAEDLFFGNWRNSVPDNTGKPRPAEYWKGISWVEQYRMSMLWSTCIGAWDCARRLSEYPALQGLHDNSGRKSEAPWYQLLAAYCRGDGFQKTFSAEIQLASPSSAKEGSFEKLIEEGKSLRLKLLSAVLSAISRRQEKAVEEGLAEYLKYYRKHEYPRQDLDDKLAIDASILVRLAEHADMRCSIPPESTDFIVHIPRTEDQKVK